MVKSSMTGSNPVGMGCQLSARGASYRCDACQKLMSNFTYLPVFRQQRIIQVRRVRKSRRQPSCFHRAHRAEACGVVYHATLVGVAILRTTHNHTRSRTISAPITHDLGRSRTITHDLARSRTISDDLGRACVDVGHRKYIAHLCRPCI